MASELPVSLDEIIGVPFLALLVEAGLFGIILLQAFLYHRDSRTDPWYINILVVVLVAHDALNVALATHAMYFYLITNYMNPASFAQPVWNLYIIIYTSANTCTIVRMFHIKRIYVLSDRNKFLVLPFIGFAIWILGASYANATISLMKGVSFREFVEQRKWLVTATLVSTAVADLAICAQLCFLLLKNRTGFAKTDSMLIRLIVYSVNSGVLTGMAASATLLTYLLLPHTLVYLGTFLLLSTLYSNSVLGVLNARQRLREMGFSNPSGRDSRPIDTGLGRISSRKQIHSLGPPSANPLIDDFPGGRDSMYDETSIYSTPSLRPSGAV